MDPHRHRDQSGSTTHSANSAAPLEHQIRVVYPISDEIDWSRPRYAWTIHQEQTYFNMFGHIAGDSYPDNKFMIDPLHAASSSNPRDELRVNNISAYAEEFANWHATSPESITGPNGSQHEEIYKYRYLKTRKSGEEDKGGDKICVVCQNDLYEKDDYNDEMRVATLHCGHEYHMHCIDGWMRHRNVCPLCNATALPQQ